MSFRQHSAAISGASEPEPASYAPSNELVAELIRAIRGIRYGSVEVTIHDSRVVQIERREKRRFEVPQRCS